MNAPPASAVTDPHIVVVVRRGRAARSQHAVCALTRGSDRQGGGTPDVDEIQLRFNGIRTLRPIDLDLDRFAQGKLTIRPADGFSPIIACDGNHDRGARRRTAGDDSRAPRAADLARHTFLSAVLPASEDLAPRSLFQLDAVNAVEFNRCSFTIRNLGPDGLPARGPWPCST